jgi:DNA adenine methylase
MTANATLLHGDCLERMRDIPEGSPDASRPDRPFNPRSAAMPVSVTAKKLRSPVKRHGGKAYLARRIIARFPEHLVYVEPFLGSGSVLLNKTPSVREAVGDLDVGLVDVWATLQARPLDLATRLSAIEYSRENFEAAALDLVGTESDTTLARAVAYVVRNRMSRGGMAKDFAWSDRLRGGQPGELNSWDTIRAALPAIAERIRRVEINCCDAITLIESNDGPDTLIYCDPPYPHATRTHRTSYAHEMDDAAHGRLLARLVGCRSRVAISGYACPLYDDALAGWTRTTFDLPNHSGQGKTKQRRIEVLWENC